MKLRLAILWALVSSLSPLFADTLTLLEPPEGATVSQLNEIQRSFQLMPADERAAYFGAEDGRQEMLRAGCLPVPVTFRWNWDGASDATFAVSLSPDSSFASAVTVASSTGRTASVDSLPIATTFYWKVTAVTPSATFSRIGTFTTEDLTPRFLRVPDVPNFRDIGGYKTLDGRRVRQNILFRSAGLNENARAPHPIPVRLFSGPTRLTPDGLRCVLGTLGVKSDIDLRSDSECRGMDVSPLGFGVVWYRIPSLAYDDLLTPSGATAFAKLFSVLLDGANYPAILHCAAGQDRTGSAAFILLALLRVPEDTLILDWQDSAFRTSNPAFNFPSRLGKLIDALRPLPGDTLNDKAETYILSLGFSQEDIARFRAFMLE